MIKSDNYIRQMCQKPTHAFIKQNGVIDFISEPFSPHQDRVHRATIARDLLNSCTVVDSQMREDKELFDPLIETLRSITKEELDQWEPMIEPFLPEAIKVCKNGYKAISSGISSYGYDVRLSSNLRIFTNVNSVMIDPYEIDEDCYVQATIHEDEKGRKYAILPPNSFMLGHTIEYFNIPSDVIVVAVGKSTWARAGVSVIITPIEPGFEGHCDLIITNILPTNIKIYVEDAIATCLFIECHN